VVIDPGRARSQGKRPPRPAIEPPATKWVFPDPQQSRDDLVALGADLEPGTLLSAYRRGIFPMPMADSTTIAWYSPVARAVLPLEGMRVTRSMRRSARRYQVTIDQAYADVVEGCADPSRPGGWIDRNIKRAYRRLYDLGWAHSFEVWYDNQLAGGLYGVAIGGLFCGESMFHRRRDASKVALMALVDLLRDGQQDRLLDVQWSTPHLASLGVVEVGRSSYLLRLEKALAAPPPEIWR
jgi:leucyl/phenylalanyl-tRNA--protein transferase